MKKKRNFKRISTIWGENFDPSCPLSEYPRPQFQRESYLCLNGKWGFEVLNGENKVYEGEIIVPYSPETMLSGVERETSKNETLHYFRKFAFPKDFIKGKVLLHFGGVDQFARVVFNGTEVTSHADGYLPFSVDVTGLVQEENTLEVFVTDLTENSELPRGKQSSSPGGIWYTAQSGIWQTVWLESVPDSYIESIRLTPDIDKGELRIEIKKEGNPSYDEVRIISEKGGFDVSLQEDTAVIKIAEVKLWSPEEPFLYDLALSYGKDKVSSYFAMRKFSVERDKYGAMRFCLNNKQYFINGVLDQGYYPESLLTPPDDRAMIFDIQTAKKLGFNTIRKHIKIEPLRWYYHCDRTGLLVWQDLVNGGGIYSRMVTQVMGFLGMFTPDFNYKRFSRLNTEGREAFSRHLEGAAALLFNSPSVAVWTIFNEGWGQFDAGLFTSRLWQLDPTRPVDSTSGWIDQFTGDFKSLHIYYKRLRVPLVQDRAVAITEFGGYSLPLPTHTAFDSDFGYKKFRKQDLYALAVNRLYKSQLYPLISQGLCAAVYTQLTDVEEELNGIITYDRKVLKLDAIPAPPDSED